MFFSGDNTNRYKKYSFTCQDCPCTDPLTEDKNYQCEGLISNRKNKLQDKISEEKRILNKLVEEKRREQELLAGLERGESLTELRQREEFERMKLVEKVEERRKQLNDDEIRQMKSKEMARQLVTDRAHMMGEEKEREKSAREEEYEAMEKLEREDQMRWATRMKAQKEYEQKVKFRDLDIKKQMEEERESARETKHSEMRKNKEELQAFWAEEAERIKKEKEEKIKKQAEYKSELDRQIKLERKKGQVNIIGHNEEIPIFCRRDQIDEECRKKESLREDHQEFLAKLEERKKWELEMKQEEERKLREHYERIADEEEVERRRLEYEKAEVTRMLKEELRQEWVRKDQERKYREAMERTKEKEHRRRQCEEYSRLREFEENEKLNKRKMFRDGLDQQMGLYREMKYDQDFNEQEKA